MNDNYLGGPIPETLFNNLELRECIPENRFIRESLSIMFLTQTLLLLFSETINLHRNDFTGTLSTNIGSLDKLGTCFVLFILRQRLTVCHRFKLNTHLTLLINTQRYYHCLVTDSTALYHPNSAN